MTIDDLDLTKTYSYADYCKWQLTEYVELIKGKIFKMTPAPLRKHQGIVSELHYAFKNYLKDHKCKVYMAPFDVRLPSLGSNADDQIFSVVQPDICVICDGSKLDRRGCIGAPDLIVEILSVSTAKKDLDDKFHLYEQSGVKEYWIVFPNDDEVVVYDLKGDKYEQRRIYEVGEQIPVGIFPGFTVDAAEIFAE